MKTPDLIIIIGAMLILYVMTLLSIADSRQSIITAINDSGKAADYKLDEIAQRIDNYDLDSLKGEN